MNRRLVKYPRGTTAQTAAADTLTCVDYTTAMRLVNDGQRVRRLNWPPGWFLLHVPGSTITVDADRPLGKAAPELVGQQVRYGEHIDIYRAGEMTPWRPFNDDIRAEWEIC